MGNIGTYGNVIKTMLPKGLKYVEGSASNNGIYDQDTNTIMWNLDYIEEESEEELTFELIVSDKQDKYSIKSSLKSIDMEDEIKSNDVEILLDDDKIVVKVANTFNSSSNIILIMCGFFTIVGCSFLGYNYIKSKKERK